MSTSRTPPSLAPHATTIVDQLPVLIEFALRCDIKNNQLQIECARYQALVQRLQLNISNERAQQSSLRQEIEAIRGIRKNASTSSIATTRSASTKCSDSVALADLTGSPISIRTKRKGVVFDDDIQVLKKIKLDTHENVSNHSLQLRRFP